MPRHAFADATNAGRDTAPMPLDRLALQPAVYVASGRVLITSLPARPLNLLKWWEHGIVDALSEACRRQRAVLAGYGVAWVFADDRQPVAITRPDRGWLLRWRVDHFSVAL